MLESLLKTGKKSQTNLLGRRVHPSRASLLPTYPCLEGKACYIYLQHMMYLVQPRRSCESSVFPKGAEICLYCLPSPSVSIAAPMFVWFSSLPRFVTARLLHFMPHDFLFLGPIEGPMARHRKPEVDLQGEMSARTISCVEASGISEEKDTRHRGLQIQANARDFLRMTSELSTL